MFARVRVPAVQEVQSPLLELLVLELEPNFPALPVPDPMTTPFSMSQPAATKEMAEMVRAKAVAV